MKALRVVILCCVSALLLFVALSGFADSHHTNVRYLLWKHHLWHDPEFRGLRYFNVDANFRMSLYGKTREEVEWWLPPLIPESQNDPNDKYYGPEVHQPGFFWIGHSLWAIIFENGRVKEIRSFEGA